MKPDLPSHPATPKRRPGRPPVYVFTKPDAELSENERRLKGAVLKRRIRQNRSYHRKKRLRQQLQTHEVPTGPSGHFHVPPPPMLSSPPPRLHSYSGLYAQPASQPPLPFPIPSLSHPLPSLVAPPSSLQLQLQHQHQHQHQHQNHHHQHQAPVHSPPPTQTSVTAPPHHSMSIPVVPTTQQPAYRPSVAALTPPPPLPSNSRPALSCFSLSPNVPDCNTLTQSNTTASTRHELPPSSSPGPNFQRGLPDPLPLSAFPAPSSQPQTTKESLPSEKAAPAPVTAHNDDQVVHQILEASSERVLTTPGAFDRHPATQPLLSQDFATRLNTLPSTVVKGLKHLALFPESFSIESAYAVVTPASDGADGFPSHSLTGFSSDFLTPLLNADLLKQLPTGRYALNNISPTFLKENLPHDMSEATQRFISHFTERLQKSDPNMLSKDGTARLSGMKMYDAERSNMDATLQLCRQCVGTQQELTFLTYGASLMRYCIPAIDRISIFSNMLTRLSQDGGDGNGDATVPDEVVIGDMPKLDAEARVRLALTEAYFDLLSFDEGAKHLSTAIGMMATAGPRSELLVSCSILALLLLAELRISERQFSEASKVLSQALRALREADLQKSSFAVCALLSLGSVYTWMDENDRAVHTVQTGLDVLKDLGFSDMPMYADGLRSLGSAHLRRGDAKEAQRLFFSALNIYEGWSGGRQWENTPGQHCRHLEVFLIESIAEAYLAQNRHEEARKLMDHARVQRRERQLQGDGSDEDAALLGSANGAPGRRLFTRHLY